MKFAAYDSENVIWGTGETEQDALSDARHWLGLNHEDGAEAIQTLSVGECTDDVATKVQSNGGQIRWEWSGTIPRHIQIVSE